MSRMKISGSESPIGKIFGDDTLYTIPLYQRPYAWTTEQSEELLQDLLRAMRGGEEPIDDLPPYFFGSIVLIKDDELDAKVVDGQQRLTTLTMLLAVLRSLIKSENADALTDFLCEKGNLIKGIPKRYRLRPRRQDAEFFEKYIQDEGGIDELKTLQGAQLSESQRNIRDNTLGFIRELQTLSEKQLITMSQFIVNRCFMIDVSVYTPDLDSVYHIFSVLNGRGLDLSYPDILKAEILGTIAQDQQESYAAKWEEMESLLGREEFEKLFFDLRDIFYRERPRKGLIEEFHESVYPTRSRSSTPQHFIDKILVPYAHILNNILKANYQFEPMAKEINTMFRWLNRLDYNRWVPVVLHYVKENWPRPDQVLHFLVDFERLVICFVISRVPPYRRKDRYFEILQAIHDGKDLYASNSPLQLSSRERQEFYRLLNGDIYLASQARQYVLLRLDTKLSEGTASYEYETVSIEHVLPQGPSPDSNWVKAFPTKEIREKYVHRLGNLVLLSRSTNKKAENYDFEEKKQKYFTTRAGISPFVLTTQVLRHREWTPAIIEQRQNQLMGVLRDLWRL